MDVGRVVRGELQLPHAPCRPGLPTGSADAHGGGGEQVTLLTYEITAAAWTDELVQRLFELAKRLGMTGKELIAYPVRPLQVDPRT